jgi:hypothetical protein
VVSVQDELFASEVLIEEFHAPDSSRCFLLTVFLVNLRLLGCKRNGIEVSLLVDLCKDCAEPAWGVGPACGHIRNESILSVSLGKSHYRFQGELFLQSIEGL